MLLTLHAIDIGRIVSYSQPPWMVCNDIAGFSLLEASFDGQTRNVSALKREVPVMHTPIPIRDKKVAMV